MRKNRKKKVLIVDDDPDDLELISSLLIEKNFQCFSVNNPSAVLPTVVKWQPDIVLLDLIFPQKSGLTCLRELKKNPQTSEIPVVVLTGIDDDVIASSTIQLGAVAYLNKESMNRELISMVSEHVL